MKDILPEFSVCGNKQVEKNYLATEELIYEFILALPSKDIGNISATFFRAIKH